MYPNQENKHSKKKVLMILHLPPPVHGAGMVGKCIKESSRINKHFQIDYINLSTSLRIDDMGRSGMRKLLAFLRIQAQVIRSLRRTQYHLYYFTLNSAGLGFVKDLLVVTILKVFGKRVIYHFHNKGVQKASNKWLADKLYKYAFRKSKSILLSPNLYADFKKYVQPGDVFYCPNGLPAVSDHVLGTKGHTGAKCRLLFLSNMLSEKGVLVLLEACRLLNEKAVAFECHFVGAWSDIPAEQFEEMVCKYGLSGKVVVHGARYNEEKITFFLSSDIFVLPTLKDCFPLVLLEAMNYGLPVVSTIEGGIPDIVIDGETGFLVPMNDAHKLAATLEMLIKEPELRRKFGEAGRKRFLEHFTLEKFEENFISVLEASTQR